MKKIIKIQTLIIATCLLFSMFIFGIQQVINTKTPSGFGYVLNNNEQEFNYFLNDEIPNIVEGTAKIFDTDSYFERNNLENYYAKVNIISNNISNLEISIGYKPADYDLLEVPETIDGETTKEVSLWDRQNNYPTKSTYLNTIIGATNSLDEEINIQWDLKSIGFNADEYVKADERIWYLRINRLDDNSICEYIEHTITENDETFIVEEYKPYINYLASFEIQFDNLVFSTLLHPFFDGTTEIIVPIRGVNHELSFPSEQISQLPTNTLSIESDYETNESHSGSKDRWAVVWGCSCDELDDDDWGLGPRDWVPVESSAFILGCNHEIDDLDDWQYYGVYDYGWNVAYCMDDYDNDHYLETCDTVSDDYFEDMMYFVDGELGSNDELIIYTHSHGAAFKNKEHYTLADTSTKNYFGVYNAISCESHFTCTSYYEEIDDITEDGTYVFLNVGTCYSSSAYSGLDVAIDTFPSNKHNSKLLTWSFAPTTGPNGLFNNYDAFSWYDDVTQEFKTLSHLFNWSFGGYDLNEISEIIDLDSMNGNFYDTKYWGSYTFKLKIPYTIENLDLFYLLEDDAAITSTHTDTQIEFKYKDGGYAGTWLTESYFLKFPETTENYYVEITADWSISSIVNSWESLLEVGTFDYATTSFDALTSIGTNDIYVSYSGRFQAMFNDYWWYDTDLDEVQLSRTNVKYIISYTNGQFWCRIKQGTTTLFQLVASTSGGYSINAIHLLFKHKVRISSTTTSTWTIKDIFAEINY